jgi:phage protein D
MDLATLSNRYGAFYVPAFAVRVGGLDLVSGAGMAISQVEVDLTLGKAARFTFTVPNTFDIEQHEFRTAQGSSVFRTLQFGAPVQIAMGYGDRRAPMMHGTIQEISTSFSEGSSPELVISGFDSVFKMTVGKKSHSFGKSKDSDAVRTIASKHNLDIDIEPTKDIHPQLEQHQESDFEFIKKLAERNHYEVYIDEDQRLHFGPPKDKGDGLLTLKWGESLLSFKPEANLAKQVSSVEVHAFDVERKHFIKGVAKQGEESGRDAARQSAGDRLPSIVHDAPPLSLRLPVSSQAEANSRAKAALNKQAKEFLKGDGETIGIPELRPDTKVTLQNLGAVFSKTYYVEQAIHRIDSGGYRTRFKVKEPSL